MRIMDERDIEITNPDLDLGYLTDDKIFVAHHEAVEKIAEIGHWEELMVYPNGGRDVEWVVDTPGVEAKEAWDEYEDILRYVKYTEEELAEKNKPSIESRVSSLETLISEMEAAYKEGVADA